jgi:hypothetical protein
MSIDFLVTLVNSRCIANIMIVSKVRCGTCDSIELSTFLVFVRANHVLLMTDKNETGLKMATFTQALTKKTTPELKDNLESALKLRQSFRPPIMSGTKTPLHYTTSLCMTRPSQPHINLADMQAQYQELSLTPRVLQIYPHSFRCCEAADLHSRCIVEILDQMLQLGSGRSALYTVH